MFDLLQNDCHIRTKVKGYIMYLCSKDISTYASRKQLLVCLLVRHGDMGIYKQAFYVNIIG